MARVAGDARALHAALLSPRGRIQHAVVLWSDAVDAFVLEHSAHDAGALRATLARYRLRKRAAIEPLDATVVAVLGRGAAALRDALAAADGVALAACDPRHAALGVRCVARDAAAVERVLRAPTRDSVALDLCLRLLLQLLGAQLGALSPAHSLLPAVASRRHPCRRPSSQPRSKFPAAASSWTPTPR